MNASIGQLFQFEGEMLHGVPWRCASDALVDQVTHLAYVPRFAAFSP